MIGQDQSGASARSNSLSIARKVALSLRKVFAAATPFASSQREAALPRPRAAEPLDEDVGCDVIVHMQVNA